MTNPAPALAELLSGFRAATPRLEIWRRYPDISEAENDTTDLWACAEVSAEFSAYAAARGRTAETVTVLADHPLADEHVWVQLHNPCTADITAVDWTARQYHNLHVLSSDPRVLAAPWPLVWNPVSSPQNHPLLGGFRLLHTTLSPTKD